MIFNLFSHVTVGVCMFLIVVLLVWSWHTFRPEE